MELDMNLYKRTFDDGYSIKIVDSRNNPALIIEYDESPDESVELNEAKAVRLIDALFAYLEGC